MTSVTIVSSMVNSATLALLPATVWYPAQITAMLVSVANAIAGVTTLLTSRYLLLCVNSVEVAAPAAAAVAMKTLPPPG
jgi:hypothetical protein